MRQDKLYTQSWLVYLAAWLPLTLLMKPLFVEHTNKTFEKAQKIL